MSRRTSGRIVAAGLMVVGLVAWTVAGAQRTADACRTSFGDRAYTVNSESVRTKGDTVTVAIRCQWVTK